MRRVLVVIQTPTFGGPHNQVLRLTGPLRERGWDTEAVLPDEPGNGAERLSAAGITVHRVPMCRLRRTLSPRAQYAQWRNAVAGVRTLRELIGARSPDVVQLCGLLTLQGALAARLEGAPVVWQLLSTFAPKPLRAAVAPVVRRWAHAVMSTGEETARQHPGIGAVRAMSFFPPVQLEQWRHDPLARARAREALCVPRHAVLVMTVGNRNRQKCHEALVEVAHSMQGAGVAAHYRVIGAPTHGQHQYYQREVVRRAERYGLAQDGRLAFVDIGDRVSSVIHAADVFVLTSRAEGVPTALLEAMAAGLPAVTTDVGSVREAVIHGETGFVVPAGDTGAFGSALRRLIEEPDLRTRMGVAAATRAVAEFSSDRCAERHVQAYVAALDRAAIQGASQEPLSAVR